MLTTNICFGIIPNVDRLKRRNPTAMLYDNIKCYRKKNNMSQDELAEKLGISRQSISLWETGQTQPSIDNIIALAKIFNISTDILLETSDNVNVSQRSTTENKASNIKRKSALIFAAAIAAIVIIGIAIAVLLISDGQPSENGVSGPTSDQSAIISENSTTTPDQSEITAGNPDSEFDLFSCCRDFAIRIGTLNGDYCIYQQPATKYGGYADEYVSISYWSDSDMVEFCLHCPLDETYSHNFYLRMRGGYQKQYEYLSSKYFRDTGESLRSATGYIDPAVFSDRYPISCDEYIGSLDGQDEFMEESRVGICDLIWCLKNFVEVEGMECDFSDFDFVNF